MEAISRPPGNNERGWQPRDTPKRALRLVIWTCRPSGDQEAHGTRTHTHAHTRLERVFLALAKGHGDAKMPHAVGAVVPVIKPAFVKRGYYFRVVPSYATVEGVHYNYKLYNEFNVEVRCAVRSNRRPVLTYNFRCINGAHPTGRLQTRLDIHRVFAFNSTECNPHWHSWRRSRHCHHRGPSLAETWKNCLWQRMRVVTRAQHVRWHAANPGVPRGPLHL